MNRKNGITEALDDILEVTKMSDNSKTTIHFGGTGLPGLLFLVFLTLKLTNVINWSWWWVTAPLWVPAATIVGIALLIASIAVLVLMISMMIPTRKK